MLRIIKNTLQSDGNYAETIENFVYDGTIGNPTTYRGKTATWVNGRRLASFDGHTFTYDGQGRRLTKDNVEFTYDSNGNLLYAFGGKGEAAGLYNTVTSFAWDDGRFYVLDAFDGSVDSAVLDALWNYLCI